MLAGQGADEPHGRLRPPPGRRAAQPAQALPRRPWRPRPPRSPARSRAPRAPSRAAHLLGGRGDADRLLRLVEITDRRCASALLGGTGQRRRRPSGCTSAEARADGRRASRDLLEQALYLDTRMFLPDGILICNDKMSMAASLELRVPFLDVELMRFVERIPGPCARAPAPGQAAAPHGDGAACCRRRCANRAQAWLLHPLRRLAAGLARRGGRAPLRARRAACRACSTPEAVAQLVAEHRRGRADHKSILYCLLELSEWHHAFVEAREPVAA